MFIFMFKIFLMLRNIQLLFLTICTLCSCSDSTSQVSDDNLQSYLSNINIDNLKNHVYNLASDEMKGRKTGEEGQKIAAQYIRNFYIEQNIEAAQNTDNYYQIVPGEFMSTPSNTLQDSENVVAFIEGSEFPDEYVVISAHYDHMGIENGEVMHGADDNASGTASVMEIARLLKKAKADGKGPKRSIVFLHCTGEEFGLHGSRYYTENALYPLNKTITDINIDMIGRSDDKYLDEGNYIYVIGPSRLSDDLDKLTKDTNQKYTQLTLDYTYDDVNHPEMLYYRSDHYNFAQHNVPVVFFFGGLHPDYHTPNDTADKILYDQMLKRTQLIFATIWQVANRNEPIKVNP